MSMTTVPGVASAACVACALNRGSAALALALRNRPNKQKAIFFIMAQTTFKRVY
jgi:hypothetical protein